MNYLVWGEKNKIQFFNLKVNLPVYTWNLRDHVQKTSRLHSSVTILVVIQTFVRDSIAVITFSCCVDIK